MAFPDHKISAFAHKIADLADQPNLPPDELKSLFDSSPEELRVAHNAACDEAERLNARVEGIVAQTFTDTVSKSMLSDELAAELDEKITQAPLDSAVETLTAADAAEAAARAEADTALETAIAGKCKITYGSYEGSRTTPTSYGRIVYLGFTPRAVFLCNEHGYLYTDNGLYGCLLVPGQTVFTMNKIVENGFQVGYYGASRTDNSGTTYYYIAFM